MRGVITISLFAMVLAALLACDTGGAAPVGWWKLDGTAGDSASGIEDELKGYFDYTAGVAGKSLRFDGQTTHLVRKAAEAPVLSRNFSIEAWIAPQTYSWNRTAIVNQAGDEVPEDDVSAEPVSPGLFGAEYVDAAFKVPDALNTLTGFDNDWTGKYKDWSIKWLGYVRSPYSGQVSFIAEADNGLKLVVDGQVVIDGLGRDKARSGSIRMEKGRYYPLELSYFQDGDPAYLRLYWSWEGMPETPVDPEAFSHSLAQEKTVKTEYMGREAPMRRRFERFFLGIDHAGHLESTVMVDGKLRRCSSDRALPLLKWSHVAATFDADKGLDLYIDGRPAGSLAAAGVVTPEKGHDIIIGMSHQRMSPANTEREPSKKIASYMVFHGLIDEVKIHDGTLSHIEVAAAFAAGRPGEEKPLEFHRMPTGPEGPAKRFSASYGRLRYSEQWERLWRVGEHPDILVRFDLSPARLMFWRGTNYGAVWVTENGKLMGDQSLERVGGGKSPLGCAEHMSDKQARYSSVRLIENHDARAVVHWRYAISDIKYGIFGQDKDGWGEWADEYYYIYPDAVATRHQILHSGHLSHEWQETIVLHQPGTRPEDNIELEAITWANMDGQAHTYSWATLPKRGEVRPADPVIQVTNLKSAFKPFLILEPDNGLKLFTGCIDEQWSRFPWWNHWPVAQLPNDGRRAGGVPDRPAHSSLSQSIEDSKVIESDAENGTYRATSLTGVSDSGHEGLVDLARSWNLPPELVLAGEGFEGGAYQRRQRAYVLRRKPACQAGVALKFQLKCDRNRPAVNPAFVVANWGRSGATVRLNGRILAAGDARIGHRDTMESSDLVVWVKAGLDDTAMFELMPEAVRAVACCDKVPPHIKRARAEYRERKQPTRLPSGPVGAGRFGAYQATLKYDPQWDKLWKVADHADVVVRFDNADHRFVFWRGTSYIPCWATYDGAWYTNEFFERRGRLGGCNSMCEPMSDKQTRYSHVRVIENTDARVVIHWRYSPVDLDYLQPYRDPMTGWGDWVDEYYYIYPDSVAVRKATIHSGSPQEDWIEYQEGIVINQPGTIPEDNINFDAVTYANLKGQSKTFTWTEDGGPDFEGAPESPCIQVVNFKNPYKPFSVVNPAGVAIKPYGGHGENSHFNWWNHWPVAQEKSDTTAAKSAERPSHSSLAHITWKMYASEGLSRTWIMLNGMTDKPAAELAPLAKSWLYAPELQVGQGVRSEGYMPDQRAYVLSVADCDVPGDLKFTFKATADSPLINPALVVKGWGDRGASLRLDGRLVEPGGDFRVGYVNTLEGIDLVAWIRCESTEPMEMTLLPK